MIIYGDFDKTMGRPPQKKEKIDLLNYKSLILIGIIFIFSIIITGIVTWQVTKAAFSKNDSTIDNDKSIDNENDGNISAEDLRLPTSVTPLDYELTVKAYLPGYGYKANEKNLTFDGQVRIRLNVSQTVKKIVLNSYQLNFTISKCSLLLGNETIGISSIETMNKFEKVFINLETAIQPNQEALLKLVYRGPIRTDMSGFYQTQYTTDKGEIKMAAVTQFEPVYARRMVPCFDEPMFKATWTITVIHPKDTVAISNGIESKIASNDDEFMITNFKSTPKMSSYLVALFISQFTYNEKTTKSGVRFRIWSRPEEKKSTEYALNSGVKCLEFYEKYFDIPFPLEKQDMVALPDFSAGAMENWGLITYRENALLYDSNIYPGRQKRRVAVVIAHELAHQWFGNLVTMKWWDALWLNEGFATLVEYLGADVISDGHFRMKEWFINDAFSTALEADSVASTHPMTFRIDKAQEVQDSFDSITYDKGGAVLSMIRNTLGENNFNAGINHYLKMHQFGNAVAEDLFKSLQQKIPDNILGSNGKLINISEFAEPWTKQLGYPILIVEKLNETHFEVKQERFKLLENAKEQEKYQNPKWKFKWDIPIWYQEGNNTNISMTWINQNEPLYIQAKLPLILNANSDGFYRVTYSETLWKSIIDQLLINHEQYSTKTRVRLIQDAFTLASVGKLNYSVPIGLIEYLKNEKEFTPWNAAILEIENIIDFYGTDPERESIQNYLDALIKKSPAKKPMSFVAKNYADDKLFYEVLSARTLISTECYLKNQECIGNITEMFNNDVVKKCSKSKMTSQCSTVPAPFRASAYCFGIKYGNEKTFDDVMNWYKNERNQVEKSNLQQALTCSKDLIVLKKLLLDAMSPNNSSFRLQDVSKLFSAVASNDVAKDSLLNFLLTRWNQLLIRISPDRSGFNRVLQSLTSGIRSEEGLKQLQLFRKTTKTANNYDFSEIEENIGVILKWRKNHFEQVSKLFEKSVKNI